MTEVIIDGIRYAPERDMEELNAMAKERNLYRSALYSLLTTKISKEQADIIGDALLNRSSIE